MKDLVISPCSNPELTLEEALRAYSALGVTKFEAFSGWVKSALDFEKDPAPYVELARKYSMRFTSFHLPQVDENLDASLARAIKAARFAAAAGAGIVIFKAKKRDLFKRAGKPFLDAIAGLKITPVLQNHKGTAISTLNDYREVLDGLADPRMQTVLEVGQFHSVGVWWRDGYEFLKGRIALVHIKDQIGSQSVPFGTGEINLPGLFRHMREVGYTGDYVIEMEVKDRENTPQYLADAVKFIETKCRT